MNERKKEKGYMKKDRTRKRKKKIYDSQNFIRSQCFVHYNVVYYNTGH